MVWQLITRLIDALAPVWAFVRVIAHLGWAALKPLVIGALQVLAALVVMFEEWGWKPLSDALAWLHRFRIVAWIEDRIARLPPYAALALFATPAAVLFPVKLLALWLLAQGHVVTATLMFVAGKIASTALVARIFILTQPALMQIPWFKRAYDWFMPWKEYMYRQIKGSWAWRAGRVAMRRIRDWMRGTWEEVQPVLRSYARAAWHKVREVAVRVRASFGLMWRRFVA